MFGLRWCGGIRFIISFGGERMMLASHGDDDRRSGLLFDEGNRLAVCGLWVEDVPLLGLVPEELPGLARSNISLSM